MCPFGFRNQNAGRNLNVKVAEHRTLCRRIMAQAVGPYLLTAEARVHYLDNVEKLECPLRYDGNKARLYSRTN